MKREMYKMKSALSGLGMVAGLLISNTAVGNCAPWMDHSVDKLRSSDTVDLCSLLGDKPVLVVNTASHCGYTPQFEGLEALHKHYQDRGLVVLGVPSDDFRQEAKTEEETATVCYVNYGVTFTMTAPQKVRGSDAHPFFRRLGAEKGEPKWNFNKYLISKDGVVTDRFDSSVKPDAAALISGIEQIL